MKIKIGFDQKGLKKTLERINEIKDFLPEMSKEFLVLCARKIQQLANERLDLIDIGANIRRNIQTSWRLELAGNNKIRLINISDKAAYVEFGTGIVGETETDTIVKQNAIGAGWEYNVDSESKNDDGSWTFYRNLEDLDLTPSYFSGTILNEKGRNRTRLRITTSGMPAQMYLYNAIMDFKEQGWAKTFWQQLWNKYWK